MTNPHNELDTHTNTQQNPLPHAYYNTTPNTHYTPQFTTLLQRYTHIFSQDKFNVPCLRIPPVKIPTNSKKIITIRPYRVPICDQQEIRNQIQQMLENGIIEQSFSPFSSPVTLVTKRDKTKRFCIDYRKVNELISSDVHPLPRIEDILDRLAQAKYFSTADISSAYWQVPIHPDSRPLLAFATFEGLYQPTRLPFGLKTSPQIYERAISQVLQRHGLDCVAHYFDDFIIYSNTLEEHQNHLRQFFAFCEAEKLQLNFAKCEFFKQSINFLGYTITAGTITPLTRNTDIIHAIKQPHNRKTLQSFLGAVNVYNKFIPEYARLRAPLNNLLKKDVVWNWNEACQKAFIDLKGNLTQHPILHLYKEGLPCQVYCDASTLGIAGILKQAHPDGNVYPVQYFSRTLRPHEKNYSISELECLAIVESVEKFRIYLMGRKFTIFSDHHALQWLKTIKNPSGRLFRWSLRLSSYEYEVRYIKGKLQYEADLLSRNPFCGFLDATLIKNHQPPPSKESSLTIDRNGLHTVSRKGVTKIILPKPLIQQLLQTVHTQYNHPGISQMSRIISTQYYWQGMSKDIKQRVKTCPTCQLTKRPVGPTYGELSQPPESKEPFDLLSLDTIAGFAKYGNTKTYLHVVVDHFSRYAWAFPSKSTSTTTYQQVLKRIFQDGSPKRLLTDRAPAFTSPKFRSFLLNRNIHPLLTTSNNPQANGLCERLNATLTGKLRLLHLENPKVAWTKLVKKVTLIYNKTPHSTTGFPPIYLMFGILPPEISNHNTPYPDIDKARKIAHTRTQNKHLQDKNTYDQRHKQPHFEVGDLVLVKLYHHPNTGKLAPYFTGPHTILEIISSNVVRIDRPNQPLQRDTDAIHVNKLKLYTEKIHYISPPAVSTYHIKHNPNYTFPFKHLTPELFPTESLRFKPTSSEPFKHLDPAIFATRRFTSLFPDVKNCKPDNQLNHITPLPKDIKQENCEPTNHSNSTIYKVYRDRTTIRLDMALVKILCTENGAEVLVGSCLNLAAILQLHTTVVALRGRWRVQVDKSIELKQINSTLSRMEGIKPPAEFVPYSNEKKWETWRESFEIFAIAVNLESMPLVRQRAILKHIAGEKTVMIYKTFHISENDTYPNVKEMLDMLTNHFKPFKNTIQRRNSFFTCVQNGMEFVTELKHLAQECEFENLTESLIRDRLIIGILDREVKRKLLEDPQLTLPRAISLAVISESTCSQVASLNEQKMIEKIEKRNWVKDTIRMENAEAGPSGINPRRERIIEPFCRTKRIRNLLAESEAEESCDEINLNEVAVKTVWSDKWSAVIIINGKKTTVHLDTGAQINVLPHKVINQWPSRPEIRPTSLKAFAYGNTELPIVGKCNVLCQYGEKKGMFEFIVADVEAQTLITGDTCEKLEILRRINHINTDEMKLCSETQKILEQYHEVFQGVGLINSECKIYTKSEYSPVQVPPRRIPTSLGAEVQSELEKMVKQGIVTKIYHETEWSHPMVVVKKKSGQIRICLDPRKLNEALVGRHFQTPAPAELLHEIPKAKYYTVLDVKSAYWHIPVAKECRDLLVMTTPFGKFRYNRLPFGLKISAQIFVEKMTNIFRDSFQNITYVDDLLIYADTIQEHNKKLKGILEKAKEKNIKFDLTKAQICLTKVRFLGHVISQNGIDPEPNKIDKFITFKRPEDKKSLQRIMGLYNYVGKFIPNLAASTSNIRGILRKNVVWHWGPKQDGEFDHIKECVRNAPSLAHFDKSKMLILQCDASKDAMGAALLQEDRPLAFASASFSDSQKQYSQIEKELLSVYYGCKKFEYLLSGHTFVVQTDHQPLLPLVKKPLSDISPRLQRLVMKLIAFDFKLQYKPGKYLIVADTLSRDTHPMDELPTPFLEDKRMVKMVRVNISDEKLVAMQKDTREDPALVKVIDYVIEGWPICKKDVDEDVKVFFDFRHRLYLWNDLLCIGSAIVIPKTQRNNMLNLLHQSHQGISAIQGLARESLFWPRMSIDIAEKVKNCEICQKHQKSKIRQPLKPFPVPDYPWQTVSLDIFYIQKKPHLLVVDRYSGYPEVFTLDPPTAINVKNKLRETFARFGIPETMMSDNGPPFRSEIMTDFCIRWGIKQLFSSPHLHRSNGLAERNIQTIKNQLIKCRDEGSDPYLAILAYRNTPKNDLPSPAQLCLSRSLRCQIPRITPLYRPYQTNWRSIENAKRKRQSSMKEQYDRNSKSYPKVNVGEDAWCQIHPRETWTPVKISAQADSPQSFEVVTPSGNRLIRNQQFIRPRDGGYEKSQLSSEPITASPEAQHPQCDSPTMGESSTAPIQRSSEETNIDQREGATTSAGIAPEPSGRPRFSRFGRELRKPQRFGF
ncbi:K02A2.6-like [Cordylochernes scorpioides]|uniref:RNA-directed DNA polymerase n=1 Tax=Cordylochernes scorpioides TaxID=51811 RepID=A0ABY6KXT1_9ARAC|nr:K02A2.6-like [Cordylochernes scorpioides]